MAASSRGVFPRYVLPSRASCCLPRRRLLISSFHFETLGCDLVRNSSCFGRISVKKFETVQSLSDRRFRIFRRFCWTDSSDSIGRELNVVVSSLRVDRVAAMGFGIGRRKLGHSLLAGKLYLNKRAVSKAAQQVGNGDVIELLSRKHKDPTEQESDKLYISRLKISDIGEQTKKGNLRLSMSRWRNIPVSREQFRSEYFK